MRSPRSLLPVAWFLSLGLLLHSSLPSSSWGAGLAEPSVWNRQPGPDATGAVRGMDDARHRLILVAAQTADPALAVVWYRPLDPDSGWHAVPMPADAPRSLTGALWINDARHDRALIFTKGTAQSGPSVWALDLRTLATWTLIPDGGGGPTGSLWTGYFDFTLDRVICVASPAVWSVEIRDSVIWTRFVSATYPADHAGIVFLYDTFRSRLLFHGGSTYNWSRFAGHMWQELWALDAAHPDTSQWRLASAQTAFTQAGGWAVYDSLRDRLVEHGGSIGWLVLGYQVRALQLSDPLISQVIVPVDQTRPVGPLLLDQRGDALLFPEGVVLREAPLSGGVWATRDSQSFIENGHFLPRTVLDARRHRLMLFGGGRPEEPNNEVWTLSLDSPSQWRKLEPVGTRPEPRAGASVAFDELNDRLLIYGGYATGRDFTDTWELRLDGAPTWNPLSPASAYAAYDAPMIFDSAKNRLLVWAYVPQAPPAKMIEYRFDGPLEWRLVNTTGTPPTNFWRQSSAFDPGRERWLIFGAGYYGPNDTRLWTYDLRLDAWGTNGLIDGHRWELVSGLFDPVEDRLVLFGGRYSSNPSTAIYPTDLFSFPMDGLDVAQPITTRGVRPGPREFPWMAYDSAKDRFFLAGGQGPVFATVDVKDFWTLDRGVQRVQRLGAAVTDSTALLEWSVPTAAGRSLEVWRRGVAGSWAFTGNATAAVDGAVQYTDTSVLGGQRYGYRLVDPIQAGPQPLDQFWVKTPPGPDDPPPPPGPGSLTVTLENPARAGVRFRVHLPSSEVVSAALYDLQGRPVFHWDARVLAAGDHDFASGDAKPTSLGVLFLRTRVGGAVITRRVVALR